MVFDGWVRLSGTLCESLPGGWGHDPALRWAAKAAGLGSPALQITGHRRGDLPCPRIYEGGGPKGRGEVARPGTDCRSSRQPGTLAGFVNYLFTNWKFCVMMYEVKIGVF